MVNCSVLGCRNRRESARREVYFQREYEPYQFAWRRPSHMVEMSGLSEVDRKVIIEFCHLLAKSKQLFNGLRDLPQYGHQQWHSYFGRTFDVYTRLWKFQQQHRHILDLKYGLKRWQIGEIASKIGQLYYHFYLRTSETGYLNEAFAFYFAIRGRSYYTNAVDEDRSDLMVKKLRYYARFIVICLLLNKMKMVRELTKELDLHIMDYGKVYDPDDQVDWTLVVDEVKSFVNAEPVTVVINNDNYPILISNRLTPHSTPPLERTAHMNLLLQEILIVGSCSDQVKFSELTIDMFRILETLEREICDEPQPQVNHSPRARGAPSASRGYLEGGLRRENPHKYLLYKPSLSQLLVYLASGCKDLPPNGAMLLYISADGYFAPSSKHSDDHGYELGGVITSCKRTVSAYRENPKEAKAPPKYKEVHCLHPGDLYPFTRRPMFLIIESENSFAFQNIPKHFGQPLVILMSPVELPSPFPEMQRQGSLFTLFLQSPLSAFCLCCDVPNVSVGEWDRGQSFVDRFLAEASRMLTRGRATDSSYLSFMGDDFLRQLMLRYVFCEVVLRLHRSFRARTHLPRASPPLPEAELLEQPTLVHIVWDLAALLDVRHHFLEQVGGPSNAIAGPAPKALKN